MKSIQDERVGSERQAARWVAYGTGALFVVVFALHAASQ
jgi:hypothetical protein